MISCVKVLYFYLSIEQAISLLVLILRLSLICRELITKTYLLTLFKPKKNVKIVGVNHIARK